MISAHQKEIHFEDAKAVVLECYGRTPASIDSLMPQQSHSSNLSAVQEGADVVRLA